MPAYLRKLAGYHGTYFFWLRVEILVLALLTLLAMAWALTLLQATRRRAYGALCAAGIAPAVLGPIAFFHYDAWPALLAVAALAALLAGRGVLSCALAAAGATAKVFPAVLIPLALLELWRRARWRGVAAGLRAAFAFPVRAGGEVTAVCSTAHLDLVRRRLLVLRVGFLELRFQLVHGGLVLGDLVREVRPGETQQGDFGVL